MSLSDNELIYIYKNTNNRIALNILKDKYFEKMKMILYSMYKIGSNHIYTLDELLVFLEDVFLISCKEYCYLPNVDRYKFSSFLLLNTRRKISVKLKKQNSKIHYILNSCKPYVENNNLCVENDNPESLLEHNNNVELMYKKEKIYEIIQTILDTNYKNIIYDRLNNLTWEKMSEKYNLSVGKLRYSYRIAINKIKNHLRYNLSIID